MSDYFFDDPVNRARLEAELDSWRGTPYRHWSGVKGRGVDCIHFVVMVLVAVGVIEWHPRLIPEYPFDWHLHNSRELLRDGVLAHLDVDEVCPDAPADGDVILYKFGKASSHAGIYFQGFVHQAITGAGVRRLPFEDPTWHKRRTHAFRVMA